MKRKRFGLIVAGGFLTLGCLGGGVYWALTQVPDFYAEALTVSPQPVREQAARKFVQQTMDLVDDIKHEDQWSEEFTHQQINSWLAEDLPNKFSGLIPKTVHEPRVYFADGAIHVGFRYEDKKWKGVVSVKARPWIAAPNQLAVEIESVRAGLVPIPLEKSIEQISKQIEKEGFETEWKQRNGNDVLVVYFNSARKGDPVLEAIEVANGSVRVTGKRLGEDNRADGPKTAAVPETTATDVPAQLPSVIPRREPTRLAAELADSLLQIRKN